MFAGIEESSEDAPCEAVEAPPTNGSWLGELSIYPLPRLLTHAAMTTVPRLPVKYDNPPVVEVVCGVLFNDLPNMRAGHLGLFWATVRTAFPRAEDRPPLTASIEVFQGEQQLQVEFLEAPPIPRAWFIAEDGHSLIQLQRDRFLFNWKRTAAENTYPSYDKISVQFEETLAQFGRFVDQEKLGEVVVRQYEMTYVNHVKGDLEQLFVDHVYRSTDSRFLPKPEIINWRSSYALPEEQGRLHILARTAQTNEGEKIIRLDLTARGFPKAGTGDSGRRAWFDLAHEWITQGFTDATTPDFHKIWKRTQ